MTGSMARKAVFNFSVNSQIILGNAFLQVDHVEIGVNQHGVFGSSTAAPTGPTTTVEYETMVYDYGEVKEGAKVKYSYKFKNTGSEPLVISDAKGSCGCTVPDWPREPIAPGASGEIKVEFDSKGKGTDDGSKQTKRVTVTANTNPAQTYLTISGIVKKDPNAKPETIPVPAK